MTQQGIDRAPVDTSSKPDVLKRLSYIEGHLNGIRRMVEEDKYCVDVLKQIREGREEEVVGELLELYQLANR
jgi:DNA-binding FrmR family transcriptional regulator